MVTRVLVCADGCIRVAILVEIAGWRQAGTQVGIFLTAVLRPVWGGGEAELIAQEQISCALVSKFQAAMIGRSNHKVIEPVRIDISNSSDSISQPGFRRFTVKTPGRGRLQTAVRTQEDEGCPAIGQPGQVIARCADNYIVETIIINIPSGSYRAAKAS